ncbi:MAG: S9 family peptidase [Rikenellaceae bacterium]|nr:S9 family peptidase [Rikenellaceae bacterium]
MKTITTGILSLLCFLLAWSASGQHMFDYSDIESGRFDQKDVRGIRPTADGLHYTVLDEGRIVKYSYKTGEPVSVILEPDDFPDGIGDYFFSPDEKQVMVWTNVRPVYRHSFGADYTVVDLAAGDRYTLEGIREPQFIPGGDGIVYFRDNDLYLLRRGGAPQPLTTDGEPGRIINGHTDWVYEEEYSFTRAFEISPDGRYVAWLRFDESRVPEISLQRYTGALYPEPLTFKYPKAGEPNSIVSLHVASLEGSRTAHTVDTGPETDQYIPRIGWTPDGHLFFYRVNRLQNHFELLLCDGAWNPRVIYQERDRRYIERPDGQTVTFTGKGDRFVVKSERSGYSHLYLHSAEKGVIDTLTRGNWEVTRLVEVTGDRAYYLSNEGSAIRNNLYSVRLNGKGKTKLTEENGFYSISPAPGFKYFISRFSSASTPLTVRVHDSSGKVIRTLEDNAELRQTIANRKVPAREFFRIGNGKGAQLNCWMVKPVDFDISKKYPVMMYQYSGPGSQQVLDRWSMGWLDVLVQEGYIVVCVDGRGTGGRGADFRKVTYGNLGGPETEDQIAAAKYLATQPFVDMSRIGIYGWSYGGFMALNCILKGADVFKMAIAVAPVTSWRYYDTIYTEIYNGLPGDNEWGYDNNSPVNFAGELKGKLLLVHGTADDNVHFQNAMAMTRALVEAGKDFDMMVYPDDNHGMAPTGRHHVMRKMIDYTLRNL